MSNTWDAAVSAAAGKMLVDRATPIVLDTNVANLDDLPVKKLESRASRVTHVLDISDGKLDPPFDIEAAKKAFVDNDHSKLPPPLASKGQLPCEYKLQTAFPNRRYVWAYEPFRP